MCIGINKWIRNVYITHATAYSTTEMNMLASFYVFFFYRVLIFCIERIDLRIFNKTEKKRKTCKSTSLSHVLDILIQLLLSLGLYFKNTICKHVVMVILVTLLKHCVNKIICSSMQTFVLAPSMYNENLNNWNDIENCQYASRSFDGKSNMKSLFSFCLYRRRHHHYL